MPSHLRPSDLRAVARLAIDATLGVTGIAENLHHNILRGASPLGEPSNRPTGGITGLVYRSIRGTTRLVGGGVDLLLRPVEALLQGGSTPPPTHSGERAAVVAALNGVIGDHLVATGNPLAIPMTLRHAGTALPMDRQQLSAALPDARPRVLLLLHGLCMHPGQWSRSGQDPGVRLAQAHGSTLLHLHYNTGLHVGTNGRELAALLEQLAAAWPVPLAEIAIVGHSMGGLVARSACHHAEAGRHGWLARLRKLVFLGTPHHGSPLERGGHVVDVVLGASPYTAAFARIGALRSAGITDLRHGSVLEDGHSHVPLPAGVDCHAVAGVIARKGERVKGKLLGDGLVTVDSALGRHAEPARGLGFDDDKQWTAQGVGHLGLMNDPEVLARIESWLKA